MYNKDNFIINIERGSSIYDLDARIKDELTELQMSMSEFMFAGEFDKNLLYKMIDELVDVTNMLNRFSYQLGKSPSEVWDTFQRQLPKYYGPKQFDSKQHRANREFLKDLRQADRSATFIVFKLWTWLNLNMEEVKALCYAKYIRRNLI